MWSTSSHPIVDILHALSNNHLNEVSRFINETQMEQTLDEKWAWKPTEIDDIVKSFTSLSSEQLDRVTSFLNGIQMSQIELVSLEYNRLVQETPGLPPIKGQAPRFRQMSPSEWPDKKHNIHYEFLQHGNGIGVEIHLEGKSEDIDTVWPAEITETIRDLFWQLRTSFPHAENKIDPRKHKGPRYYFLFSPSASVIEIAQAMVRLIHETRKPITNCLIKTGIIE